MSVLVRKHSGGFTLVSLLVSVAILAILVGIGVPYFQASILRSTIGSYTNSLNASAKMARSEAMKRKTTIAMCPSTDGATCASGNWNQGWIVYVQSTAEVLQRQQELNANYIIDSTLDDIVFEPDGTGASQANITICRALPSPGDFENVLTISATGRSILNKTTAGACSM